MPLMLAVPQDVPAGQLNGDSFGPPTGSTYVASYANVPAVAGAATTRAATAAARASTTFRISTLLSLANRPMRFPGQRCGRGRPAAIPTPWGLLCRLSRAYPWPVASTRERRRCRERLERLSTSGLDSESMRRAALADLQAVIGFDRWCWP